MCGWLCDCTLGFADAGIGAGFTLAAGVGLLPLVLELLTPLGALLLNLLGL